jgi:ABC-type methionine transport system permease subunit
VSLPLIVSIVAILFVAAMLVGVCLGKAAAAGDRQIAQSLHSRQERP